MPVREPVDLRWWLVGVGEPGHAHLFPTPRATGHDAARGHRQLPSSLAEPAQLLAQRRELRLEARHSLAEVVRPRGRRGRRRRLGLRLRHVRAGAQELLIALLALSRPARLQPHELATLEAREGLAEILFAKAVEPLGALPQLARRLRSAQHQHRQQAQLRLA